jgi:hypothetical protein
VWGYDSWGFLNSKQNLGRIDAATKQYVYDISDADKALLFSRISNIEAEKIEEVFAERTHGSCYGMAVTSVLQTLGYFSAEDLVPGVNNIGAVTSKNINTQVRSAINYYQMLQYTKAISQRVFLTERTSDEIKLKKLIDSVSAGRPTVLGYTYNRNDGSKAGHAVVAYAAEKDLQVVIPFSATEYKQFNVQIRIYNNDVLTDDSAYDMYINTNTWEWCIPMTNTKSEYSAVAIMNQSNHRNGNITFVESDTEILNYLGLFGGNQSLNQDEAALYYAQMNMIPMETRYILRAVADPYDGSLNDDGDDGDIRLSSQFFEENEDVPKIGASMESGRCYALQLSEACPVGVTMDYEHCLLGITADASTAVTFSPKARIACSGATGSYQLSMVLDEGSHATDWYKLTVSGRNGGDLLLMNDPAGRGWLLQSDSMDNITVNVKNRMNSASRNFSANAKKVLIYEIDADTIGIRADTNGDGTFETEVEQSEAAAAVRGDLDGDGEPTATDAQSVLMAYTEALASGRQELTGDLFNAADVDKDGEITAADAQYILLYFVQKNVVGDPKDWDEIIR